ncbi:uncharacterized protein I206_106172 [Kwoniella pini CBS 10737]|uniref:DNA polymerase epsilon p12 subunit n=1 Tax=Kwoniella pini CBS 10737 TaxID=1296096 RepID=A0A1B9I193_9TREE|nr:DNA polymerase epsilon p12 subunit [Kwoniella pini CBS 10737]OCF49306.1 DNA polymerase epsilon p12 subunit [Kwoniella pini CBS 10737]
MQVEYESSSPNFPGPIQHSPGYDKSMIEEGNSFRPGEVIDSENENEVQVQSEVVEGEEEEEQEEEDNDIGENSNIIEKPILIKNKINKQRQSLAEKQLGTTIFPISRIKKIIKNDKELENMSSEAVFMISVATEYFIKHFMEEGYTKARLEKRKIVNYKDMAAVVARSEEFDFLKDVIPQPMNLSEALERRKQKMSIEENTSYDEETSNNQNGILLNDEDLPPLVNSTNPLFPNAIMKKPPNTHAKTAIPKPIPPPTTTTNNQFEENEELMNNNNNLLETENISNFIEQQEEISPKIKNTNTAPNSNSKLKKNSKEQEKEKEKEISKESNSPKIFTGKNAPSTPHGLTTRGAARRSLVGTDVDMSPVNAIRNELAEDEDDVVIDNEDRSIQ